MTSATREGIIVIGITVMAYGLAAIFDVFEWLYTWSRAAEDWEIDEFLVPFFVLLVGSVWFALRRLRDLRAEVIKRQDSETAQRTTEEHFRNLIEGSMQGIIVQRDWEPLFVNQAYADLLSYDSPEEIMAMTSIELQLAPYERERLRRYKANRQRGEPAPTQYEYDMVRKDGSVITVQNLVRVVHWQGEPAVQSTVIDITERKQAEKALRESETRLTLAQEAADIGTADWDVKSDRVHWSTHQFRLHGATPTEDKTISLKDWRALVHPDDRVRSVEVINATVKSGKGFSVEYRIVWPDDQVRWLCGTARVIRDDNGRAVRMIGVSIDISERKRTEEALGRFEGMVSASSDLMAFVDKTYTYLAANTAYVEALGKTKKAVVGKRVPDVLGRTAFDSRIKPYLDKCLSGEHINYQLWLNLPARGSRYVDVRYDPYRDPNDVVSGVVVGIRDITEHKKAEQALRESELRYRSIVENAPLCIYEIDRSGRFISMNPAGMRMMRVENQGDIIEMPFLDAVCSNERGRVEQLLKKALAGKPAAFDFSANTNLGRGVFTSTLNPIRTADGTVEKVMGMSEDITERKHAEDQLRASHQRLRNLATQLQVVREEERTIIAREVHDEMGQALTALKMDLAWVAKNLPKGWKTVPDRVRSMVSLTDSTLTTVRQLSSRLRPAMLDDLGLEAAIEWQLQDFLGRGNYECGLELKATELRPDKKRDIVVFRILQEALTNVARHAAARQITVKLKTIDKTLLLQVTDDGKGITDDALASTYSLGLTGMYERARTLGGSLVIERGANGKGTVLRLRVPHTSTKHPVHA